MRMWASEERADAPPLMAPVIFDDGRCFGWFHAPASGAAVRRGVVLCPPFGHEAICTGRGMRALAETLAAAGMPVLRFDYPGAGDSAGDEAPERLESWIEAARAGAEWLRAEARVREVALCGFRLGADLAAAAAARLPREVTALALLAPVGSGRAWRRQLLLGAGGDAATGGEWLESSGFRLHRSDLDAAARTLDLGASLLAADAPRVLVMAASPVLGAAVTARLRDAGVALEHRAFEGLGAFLTDAHLSIAPRAAFVAVARWLRAGALPATEATAAPAAAVLRLAGGARDTMLRFGAGRSLVGVLCEPAADRALRGAPAVLLPNTGANGRAGNGRMAVRLARRLAAAGVASFRVDATGIGDGGVIGMGDGPPDTYHPRLVRDVTDALDLLERRGFSGVAIAGICSGAHAAFEAAALGDGRVRGLVLVNLPAFDRAAGGAAPANGVPLPPGEFRTFRRAQRVARRLLRRFFAEADGALARFGLETGLDRAGRTMRAILARRTDVVVAYSERDPGLREFRIHFGRGGRRLLASGTAHSLMLDGADHSLLPRAMQDEFVGLVEAQLVRLRAAPTARPLPRPDGAAARLGAALLAALTHRAPTRPTRHAG